MVNDTKDVYLYGKVEPMRILGFAFKYNDSYFSTTLSSVHGVIEESSNPQNYTRFSETYDNMSTPTKVYFRPHINYRKGCLLDTDKVYHISLTGISGGNLIQNLRYSGNKVIAEKGTDLTATPSTAQLLFFPGLSRNPVSILNESKVLLNDIEVMTYKDFTGKDYDSSLSGSGEYLEGNFLIFNFIEQE